jgi:hypothetical protein
MTTFTQLSNDATASSVGKAGPAAVGANQVFDLLVWDDAGTIRLTRSPPWASDTSMGTGPGTAERAQRADGYFVNYYDVTNGPPAQRGIVVGSVRSDASSQFVDSVLFRWVSNIYNAVPRSMIVLEATANWNVASLTTWLQVRAQASNALDYLQSVSGNVLTARAGITCTNSGTSSYALTAIGVDNTTPASVIYTAPSMNLAGQLYSATAMYSGVQSEGRHRALWLEYAQAGTQNNLGAAPLLQSGISGEIFN